MDKNVDVIFVLNKEKRQQEWQVQYGNNFYIIENQLNTWLMDENECNRQEIVDLFHTNEFICNYLHTEKIAVLSLFLAAYEIERDMGLKETILDRKMKIQDFVNMYNDVKFLIWHVDFGWEKAEERLVDYFKYNKLSWYSIQFLVNSTAFSKTFVMNKVIKRMQ